MSPEERFAIDRMRNDTPSPPSSPAFHPDNDVARELQEDAIADHAEAHTSQHTGTEVNAGSGLLDDYHRSHACGSIRCNHGTFTPRARSPKSSRSSDDGDNNSFREHLRRNYSGHNLDGAPTQGRFAGSIAGLGERAYNTTKQLASQYGIKGNRMLYLSYYIPFIKWIRQYRWSFLKGDVIAAITMASFYIPMSLSYASNLGHIPPINGLYSFVFSPLIYALLGSCPQMVVGPEAAGSLLVGTVVQTCIERGEAHESDDVLHAQIAGVVTGIAGGVIFIAGLSRLGFLDSVLSRPFLRGFISAIGFVIIVDQLIPELGLSEVATTVPGVVHGSSAAKVAFLVRNIGKSHVLTALVSIISFVIIMVLR